MSSWLKANSSGSYVSVGTEQACAWLHPSRLGKPNVIGLSCSTRKSRLRTHRGHGLERTLGRRKLVSITSFIFPHGQPLAGLGGK